MALGHKQGLGIGQKADVGLKVTKAQQVQLDQLEILEHEETEEEEDAAELEVEGPPPEPPEEEDAGNSDTILGETEPLAETDSPSEEDLPLLDDESGRPDFEFESLQDAARISRLPRRVRPPVWFRIDNSYVVHTQSHAGGNAEARTTHARREVVAQAIAEHLRREGVALKDQGDWVKIPAIGGFEALVALAPPEERTNLENARSLGAVFKDFAIELPNRDVIAPDTVLDRARGGSRLTRAAALRLAASRPAALPTGEEWTESDWSSFERNQRKKGREAEKSEAKEPVRRRASAGRNR